MRGEIEFDVAAGICRLPRVVYEALVELARGVELPQSLRAPLDKAGLVVDGRLNPVLEPPLSAAANPECVLALFQAGHDGHEARGAGSLVEGAGLLTLDTTDKRLEVLPVAPGFLPSALARLFGLGPRPRLDFQPVLAPHGLVEDLLSDRPRTRSKAARYVAASSADDEQTQRFAALLESGPWTWNNVRVEWPSADGTIAARALHVWDSDDGLAIFENRGERWPSTRWSRAPCSSCSPRSCRVQASCSMSPPSAPVRNLLPKGGEGSQSTSGSVGSPGSPTDPDELRSSR